MALEITNTNFKELIESDKLVVIDFGAEWCGPCKMVAPIIEELAKEYEGKVEIGKCDVDQNDEAASQFKVRNIPTIVFIKGGEVVDKVVGATTKAVLDEKIKSLM